MKTLFVVAALLLVAMPAYAQSTPQPSPTPGPLPQQDMYEALATQNAQLADAPNDLTQPDGSPLLPTDNSEALLGYAKWLLSPAAADEWAGPFAPVFQHIGIALYINFALMGVYGLIYVVSSIGGWVAWLWYQAHRILDLTLQTLQAAPVVIVLAVIVFVAFLLFGSDAVMQFIDDRVQDVLNLANNILGDTLGR